MKKVCLMVVPFIVIMLIIYVWDNRHLLGEQYEYSQDFDTDAGSADERVELMEKIVFVCNSDFKLGGESGARVVDEKDFRVTFGETLLSKSSFYFGCTYLNVAELKIVFDFDDGLSEEVYYYATDLAFGNKFYLNRINGKITQVTIEITPLSISKSCNYNFDSSDFKDSPITKLDKSTIKSNVDGVIECYDRYKTAIDSIIVEKGGTYSVAPTTKSFSVLYRRKSDES